jgi:hypothetical protein
MNGKAVGEGKRGTVGRLLVWGTAGWLALAAISDGPTARGAQRPSTDRHVRELAAYLDQVEIAEPVAYRHLAVYPVLVSEEVKVRGRWLTLDDAVRQGVLVVQEKGSGGSVPVVVVENRSRDTHVFILAGEILSGGKQTRTVRRDVILSPGQRVELDVFCVEAHRWEGEKRFSAAGAMVPQSIQKELRRGSDQKRVWSEISRNNMALEAENATGSLELAIKARPVREKLSEVRRAILPKLPAGTVGFVFVSRGRALGAELFGNEEMAEKLLGKLLDAYAVDCILLGGELPRREIRGHGTAVEFFHRVCRAGSERTGTPGSGAGIRTRSGGLLGDGVSLGGSVVHYGAQIRDRIVPLPGPRVEPR